MFQVFLLSPQIAGIHTRQVRKGNSSSPNISLPIQNNQWVIYLRTKRNQLNRPKVTSSETWTTTTTTVSLSNCKTQSQSHPSINTLQRKTKTKVGIKKKESVQSVKLSTGIKVDGSVPWNGPGWPLQSPRWTPLGQVSHPTLKMAGDSNKVVNQWTNSYHHQVG